MKTSAQDYDSFTDRNLWLIFCVSIWRVVILTKLNYATGNWTSFHIR